MIDWTILRSKFGAVVAAKKFEELALQYVQDVYPGLKWFPTQRVGDGNRDGYAALDGDQEIWEEAKYRNGVKGSSHKKDRALERKDVDSAVLSGLLYGKVRLIIFVTNAHVPDEVLIRSALGARIRGIEISCVLAPQLEQWLRTRKSVYINIFEEPLPRKRKDEVVISVNHVGLYDLKSVDFSPLKRRREFFVGERALLEVVLYSSVPVRARLEPINSPFRLVLASDYTGDEEVSCPAGMSTLFYLVQMDKAMTGPIPIRIRINDQNYYRNTPQVSVLPQSGFNLVYTRQQDVSFHLRQKLNDFSPFQQGSIATLYAESSMGKSHVLQKMQEEVALQYDATLITFDSRLDSMSNYILLCKALLFLVYGNVFWDLISDQPNSIQEFKDLVVRTNTTEIFAADLLEVIVDGCFDSAVAARTIQYLIRRVKQTGYAVISTRRTKVPKILFVDDFQYLNQLQAELMFTIFEQMNKYKNSNIVVVSATKGKFHSKSIEDRFLQITPNRYELDGLSSLDKSATICNIFSLPTLPANALSDRILPRSPLLAREVLRNIAQTVTKNASIDDILASYLEHAQNAALILHDKLSQCREQFYLLDIVFKFKKGLPKSLIEGHSAFENKQLRKDIKELVSQDLVIVKDGQIKPYHDYYVVAYHKLRGKKAYNKELGEFLKYILSARGLWTDMDYNQVLAMLLRCGRHYARSYNAAAKAAIETHIQHTQFGAARQLCEYYWEQIKPLGPQSFSHEDWRLLYLYADCLVHCDQQHRAHEMLQEIYLSAPENSLEKYEAGASLLNQDFWEIQPQKVIADSFEVESKVKWILEGGLSTQDHLRMVKAYSSCLNRRMVSYLLLDDRAEAKKVYHRYMRGTAQFYRDTFQTRTAIIMMDYARGISYWEPREALRLMRLALKFFESDQEHHYRRILICRVDLALLQSVTSQSMELQDLMEAKHKLLDGEFLSEYVKAVMKQLVCELIAYSQTCGNYGVASCAEILSSTERQIQDALMDTGLQLHDREIVMRDSIYAFLAVRRGDYKRAITLLQRAQEILKNAGTSYHKAIQHNLKNAENMIHIAWWTEQTVPEPNTFYVDCRFW